MFKNKQRLKKIKKLRYKCKKMIVKNRKFSLIMNYKNK